MDIKDIKNTLKEREIYVNGWKKMKRAAVIIPLVDINKEAHIIFQVRARKLKSQPGDICFPGGKIERGEKPVEAALRELREELGLEKVEVIKSMDVLIRHDGLIIHPFLAEVKSLGDLNISKDEVEEVFYLPLSYLLKNEPLQVENEIVVERGDNFPYHLIVGGENYKFKNGKYVSSFYQYKDYVIWGITASMLKDFLETIK